MRNILKSAKGFSLMEVVVTAALVGMGAVAVMNLMEQSTKAAKLTEERFTESEILGEIKSMLGDSDTCSTTFAGKNALSMPEGEITSISDVTSGGTPVQRFVANATGAGTGYGASFKKILGYSLKSEVFTGAPPVDAVEFESTATAGTAILNVRFERKFQKEPFTAKIRLRVTTVSTSDRSVSTCRHAGTGVMTAQMLCDDMRGMRWNTVDNVCEPKPFVCSPTWNGDGSRPNWTGTRTSTCPTGCIVNNVELGATHNSGGDWDNNSIRVQCCCLDLT